MKIAFIGQAPSKTSDPKSPLSGDPLASRLAAMIGVDKEIYLRKFNRRNLLDEWPGKNGKGDLFPVEEARKSADQMLSRLHGKVVVFVGIATARMFRFNAPPLRWREFNGGRAAVLPHPSGVNRWYNDPKNKKRATRFMRVACAG